MRTTGSFVEVPPVGWSATVRHVAGIGLAGLATGVLVGGIGSRIFMRVAGAAGRGLAQGLRTEAGFTVGEVTLGGTIALVVFVGILFGIVGAVLYVVFAPWLVWAGRWRGLLFGILLFVIGSASSDVMNPDNRDFFLLDRDPLNVSMIVALFLAFGVVMELFVRRFHARMPHDRRSAVGYSMLAGVGAVLALPLLVVTMFTQDGCSCGPSPWIAWFTVSTGIGTLAWWWSGRDARWSLPSRIVGWTGLLGAVGFGLVRAVSDAAEILG